AMAGVPGHAQAHHHEHDRQPLGGAGQEVGRAAGAEHGRRGTGTEAGAGGGAGAALHEDEHDHRDRDEHVDDTDDGEQHGLVYLAAAAAMARKSRATSDAPPIRPPSTSGRENSSAALAGLTLPPYRIGSEPAIVASCAASSPRMKACTSWACSGLAVRPVPMAQTGS